MYIPSDKNGRNKGRASQHSVKLDWRLVYKTMAAFCGLAYYRIFLAAIVLWRRRIR
jgi:hypothetical protein